MDVGDLVPTSVHGGAAYKTAKASSDLGDIVIRLGLGRRSFSISLDSARGTFVWASGGTDDLVEVARLMDAWRGGVQLREMTTRFPFMSYPRLSQGYEDGRPVKTQFSSAVPLFLARYSLPGRDCFDRSAGGICVDERPDGSYQLWASYDETRGIAQGIEEVADTAKSLLEGFQG